jgi:3-methyl-2-oxobutanoate hydroxymethyltransferase
MLTAYDFSMASFVDEAGMDMILVGDSLGMVVLGYESTVPVTMEEMLHHCRAVRRGVRYAFLVGDMPFMSYNISREEAIRNAGRFLKETDCDAVKLEGGLEVADTVRAIVEAGSVMAHIGTRDGSKLRVPGPGQGSGGRPTVNGFGPGTEAVRAFRGHGMYP